MTIFLENTTYAKALKLDVTELTATLEGELSQTEKFSEPPPLTNQPRGTLDFLMLQLSKLDWRKGLAALIGGVLLLVFGLGYLVWRHQRSVRGGSFPAGDLMAGRRSNEC